MFGISAKRIFRSGMQNFFRNGIVSLSSILVMSITLFIMTSIIILGGFLNYSLNQVRNKVDVNVYFVTGAADTDIFSLQKSLEALPEVSSVQYVSSDQALADFKSKHQNDELTLQALDELGDNPLGAVLNIKAKDPSQYAGIATFLDNTESQTLSEGGTNIIDTVNYAQNKVVIDRLSGIIKSVNIIGIWFAIIFVLVSLIVTFNTIRLTIFMAKDEISVMRLVGASNSYIKGPFIVSGLLCGIISSILILIIFAAITFVVNHYYNSYFVGFDLFQYYIANFLEIFAIIFGSGIILGCISSYLAVQKYLKG
jgi:cell division transport system permease protein